MSKEHKFILQKISCRWGYPEVGISDTWQLSKQVSMLFLQMDVHVCSLFGQIEDRRKVFLGEVKMDRGKG